MFQFFDGNDNAFADLENRAREACIIFNNEDMPPGVAPAAARVGFEVDSLSGRATLFVDKNLDYQGNSDVVRHWLEEGRLEFADFDQLRDWIQNDLKAIYECSDTGDIDDSGQNLTGERTLESITDMSRLREELEMRNRPQIDEESLFNALTAKVRGQDDALRILSRRVVRHIFKENPVRPLTVFAVGQSGVGKTQSADSLAQILSDIGGSRFGYLRIDCSEYSERHRVSQLLGAPPGYVGYGDRSPLADILTSSPKCVILFDEIEKAHPDFLRTLMNAMDAGRLSTSSGSSQRVLDCRQAVFFFTSNLASSDILQEVSEQNAFEDAAHVEAICRSKLVESGIQPELAGRVGCFLLFKPLSQATQAEVITLSIVDIGREYGVDVVRIEPEVIASILDSSQSSDFGARPARNTIEDTLGPVLAEARSAGNQRVRLTGPPYACLPVDTDTQHPPAEPDDI